MKVPGLRNGFSLIILSILGLRGLVVFISNFILTVNSFHLDVVGLSCMLEKQLDRTLIRSSSCAVLVFGLLGAWGAGGSSAGSSSSSLIQFRHLAI
ncbi:hypothetical protein TIFTF001_029257 [Ficus carica]|uniref:Uncharacterized protein n=1 Tax=Ficus carica TaxID=3494 RepID=A0AA88J1A9_FICCA|nr:hypothetical protein TIFTF001_029257 [Ficus carica]